jgi:hypothetical protein
MSMTLQQQQHQQQHQQQEVAVASSMDNVDVSSILPICCSAGANSYADCHELLSEKQQVQQAHAERIASTASTTTAQPAARKGRKLRRRPKKSTAILQNDPADTPSTSCCATSNGSTTGTTTSSVTTKDDSNNNKAPNETRASRRASKQNAYVHSRKGVTTTQDASAAGVTTSTRANTASSGNTRNTRISSHATTHGKSKKGMRPAAESAIMKELYVAIRCEFVRDHVRRVMLVSWDHETLWEASCLDDDPHDEFSAGGASQGKWTVTEYSNNNQNSNKNQNSNISSSASQPQPCPLVRIIWRHQSIPQVRLQLQQQIAARVLIGHNISQILKAWSLPRHPACNVRDAATFSKFMAERVDPLSVMVVPRSLALDLMPHYLNMPMHDMNDTAASSQQTDMDIETDALRQQAVACMLLYQTSRVEWEQEVSRWMNQQERQRAIRNERLAAAATAGATTLTHSYEYNSIMPSMCCESYPLDLAAAVVLTATATTTTATATAAVTTSRTTTSNAGYYAPAPEDDCWSMAGGSNHAEDIPAAAVGASVTTARNHNQNKVIRQKLKLHHKSNITARDCCKGNDHSTTPMGHDDNNDEDYDYDGALVAAVESLTPFLSSATTITKAPSISNDCANTWGDVLAMPPPCPKESSLFVSNDDLLDCDGQAEQGHLPSCLLNDSSDEEVDVPRREKRGSNHPTDVDDDDWLDQDDPDQQQQPKMGSPQGYWFRRRRSVSPPCVRTDTGGTSKLDSNSKRDNKSLNQSERQHSRFFPRSPAKRTFFSPPGFEMRKSPPPTAGVTTTTEGGGNQRPRSETETTTTLMNEVSNF